MVSVIMPVRNEEKHISCALDSVLDQDYPPAKLEILVIDGCSEDRTREIVQDVIGKSDHVIRLLENTHRIVPPAFNLGLAHAIGSVIVRVDGHCALPANYIATCIHYLETTGADCVGGQLHTIGDGYIASTIALAQSSPFGVGGAAFRTGRKMEGYVDTVAFGAYRRSVFDRAGGYDERLVRHQDYEFNLRLRQSGGRIFYTPALKVKYYSRVSLKRLISQYYQYGYWKALVASDNAKAIRIRHIAPILLVLWLLLGLAFSICLPDVRAVYAISVGIYLVAILGASLVTGLAHNWRSSLLLPAIFAMLHISWGMGFWGGVIAYRARSLAEFFLENR